jgi:hypothetical protein
LAVELDNALAGDNFHALGLVGAEMELAGINQAQRLFALIGKKEGMADDPSVKIDVRFGDRSHAFEFSWQHWYNVEVKTRMKQALPILLLCAWWLGGGTGASAQDEVRDATGAVQRPLDAGNKTGAVLIFYWHDCPICNSYAPEINRICAACTNFAFYIVQVDPDLTPAAALKHAKDFALRPPVLLDGRHRLVKLAGATATPEAVVFGKNKDVLYRGRIDNLYPNLSQRRAEATEHDLRDALDAITAGKTVKTQWPAMGCAIQERP